MTDRVIVRNDGSRVVVRAQGPTGDSAALVAPLAHAASHIAGGTDDLYDPTDIGVETVEPFNALFAIGSVTATTGRAYIVPFRARTSKTISTIYTRTRGTAATSVTAARMGLFTIDSSTNVATLVARTANDTSLWGATFTQYTRTLDTAGGYPSSYDVVRGSWYGFGMIVISTASPVLYGSTGSMYPTSFARLRQAPAFYQASQSDLWTSVDIDSLTTDPNAVHIGAY